MQMKFLHYPHEAYCATTNKFLVTLAKTAGPFLGQIQ